MSIVDGIEDTFALVSGFSSLSEVMCVLVMGLLIFKVEMQIHREYLLLFCGYDKIIDNSHFKRGGFVLGYC